MKLQSFSMLVIASLMLFASCAKKNNVKPVKSGDIDVAISLNLGSTTRAAMGDAQAILADKAAATVESVTVALVNGTGIVKEAKKFTKDTEEFNKLTKNTAVGQEETTGGYKFTDVDGTATKAFVIVNYGPEVTKGDDINNITYSLKAKANEVTYSDSQLLTAVGNEPYGVDPVQGADSKNVKKAEFELKGDMNRFQLATKFSSLKFKDGKREEFITWKKKYVEQHKNEANRTFDSNDEQYIADVKAKFGDFNNGQPNDKWNETYKIVDVTAQNQAVFMNRFHNTYAPVAMEASNLLEATTTAGTFTTTDGTWKPNKQDDLSATAAYFNENGFETSLEPANKVLAFNFFHKGVTSYEKDGNAPKLHFYFSGNEVSEDCSYLTLVGYQKNEDGSALSGLDGNRLLDIDMSKINNGNGIIVESDDPVVPGGGKPDISNDPANVIVRVQVKAWVKVNVKPIVE